MNRQKLQKLRKEGAQSQFMRDIIDALLEDDDEPWPEEGMVEREAKVLRDCAVRVEALGGFGQVVDVLRDTANDIEQSRIDRSLRGWVLCEFQGAMDDKTTQMVRYAVEDGTYSGPTKNGGFTSWHDIEAVGWTVRPLTPEDIGFKVRKWYQLTIDEQNEYIRSVSDYISYEHDFNLAIDIATRRTP